MGPPAEEDGVGLRRRIICRASVGWCDVDETTNVLGVVGRVYGVRVRPLEVEVRSLEKGTREGLSLVGAIVGGDHVVGAIDGGDHDFPVMGAIDGGDHDWASADGGAGPVFGDQGPAPIAIDSARHVISNSRRCRQRSTL